MRNTWNINFTILPGGGQEKICGMYAEKSCFAVKYTHPPIFTDFCIFFPPNQKHPPYFDTILHCFPTHRQPPTLDMMHVFTFSRVYTPFSVYVKASLSYHIVESLNYHIDQNYLSPFLSSWWFSIISINTFLSVSIPAL